MAKSALARVTDELQTLLNPLLRQAGFRHYGRTYNRTTVDGLTHVIGFQMGSFDPPGTTYFPGLRKNLYGRFAVNLGVYVPEVARYHGGREAERVVHDYDCCIRTRLGRISEKERWWKISASAQLVAELVHRFQEEAFPLFHRFERRNQVLSELREVADNTELVTVPRIVCAIILWNLGKREEARTLLAAQSRDNTHNPGHRAYVFDLAQRLGIDIAP